MDHSTEIIELKFDGNNISPSKVKASDIAKLTISYERAIIAVIKETHPNIDEDCIVISIEEIKEGSIHLKYVAHQALTLVIPAYITIAGCFKNNNFNNIPNSAIEELRVITAFTKNHNCDGEFIRQGVSLASFNRHTEVKYNEAEIIKGETVIYGEVQIAGGKKSARTTIKINDEYTISFEVNKEIAKQLAAQLYNTVGIQGEAEWDRKTYRILDFKAKSVIILEEKSLDETFKELGNMLGQHINRLGDYNTYLS
jgi:hypothetical protein